MDCLVTTLRGSVNNGELPILGAIEIEMAQSSVYPYLRVDGTTKAKIVGTGYFTDSAGSSNLGQEITATPFNNAIYVNCNNGDKLLITPKYNCTLLMVEEKSGGVIIKANSVLNLSYLSALTQLNISKYILNVNCDLNTLSKNNIVLTKVRWHNNPLLVGDIETIVENMVSNGRNSGTLSIAAEHSGLRLNGVTFMEGASQYILITFNSATNVTVNAGEQGAGALLASWDGSTWTYGS